LHLSCLALAAIAAAVIFAIHHGQKASAAGGDRGATGQAAAGTPESPDGYPTADQIVATVEREAAANGVTKVESITVYFTTRAMADVATGQIEYEGGLPPGSLEALAYTTSDFVGYDANVPAPADLPRGSILQVGMNHRGVLDWGILQSMPDPPSDGTKPTVISINH
jgi:hypothetical protein